MAASIPGLNSRLLREDCGVISNGDRLWPLVLGLAAGLLLFFIPYRNCRGIGETVLGFGFLFYGMVLMSDELTRIADFPTVTRLFSHFDCTPLDGVMPFGAVIGALCIGLVVTMIIQSSSASTGIIIALGAGGLINLYTAMPLVLGANIGTSVTGWILCLSYISSSDALSLLSSSTITAAAAIAGILLRMLGKTSQKRHTGDILLGFAVLMYGMNAMSGAVSPLRESEGFLRLMTMFENPILGILIGTLITAV